MNQVRALLAQIRDASHNNPLRFSRLSVSILKARRAPNRIGLTEYFDLGLDDPEHISHEQRPLVIGRRASTLLDLRLNRRDSRVLANDKIVCYQLLQHYELPAPVTLATWHASGRFIGGEARLDTADALTDWLASLKEPVFSKPNHGTYGRLARLIERFDPAMKRLELGDGSSLPLEVFVREVADPRFEGNLFQRIVRNAAPLEEAVGKTLSTVRLIVVVTPQGPTPHLAFWKVANGKNMTDNFSRGRTGNLLASIDLDTGSITNAIARLGANGSIDAHPTTGARLLGLRLPFWRQALDTVSRAAIHFPGLRLQNWDVALTDEGPVLLEVNTEANLEVPQAVSGRGFLDGPAGEFLRRQLAP